MKTKVDYNKIYDYLKNTITASSIALGIGVERIYGGTMNKLVRDGYLDKCPLNGYYHNNVHG